MHLFVLLCNTFEYHFQVVVGHSKWMHVPNVDCCLQNLLEFLESAEDKFAGMGALGTDIDAVKRQIEQLKDFKADVDPHMVKVEALNR